MPSKMWDEMIYPFLNFSGAAVEVYEWISNFRGTIFKLIFIITVIKNSSIRQQAIASTSVTKKEKKICDDMRLA